MRKEALAHALGLQARAAWGIIPQLWHVRKEQAERDLSAMPNRKFGTIVRVL